VGLSSHCTIKEEKALRSYTTSAGSYVSQSGIEGTTAVTRRHLGAHGNPTVDGATEEGSKSSGNFRGWTRVTGPALGTLSLGKSRSTASVTYNSAASHFYNINVRWCLLFANAFFDIIKIKNCKLNVQLMLFRIYWLWEGVQQEQLGSPREFWLGPARQHYTM